MLPSIGLDIDPSADLDALRLTRADRPRRAQRLLIGFGRSEKAREALPPWAFALRPRRPSAR